MLSLMITTAISLKANVKSYPEKNAIAITPSLNYGDTLDKYRNDPDWQIMARIQYQFINSLVSNRKVNLEFFDFNNENNLLTAIGMSREEYLAQVKLNREAAARFIKKYNISGTCSSCTLSPAAQVNTLRNVLASFRTNNVQYSNFAANSLSVNPGTNVAMASSCCGFWFYACCSVCALTIEVFPVYLACCALCYHSECCN